jgi:hypothetical protein
LDRAFSHAVLAAAALLVLCGCTKTGIGYVPTRCLHPAPHAVADSTQAILSARTAWYCMHPKEEKDSEQVWLRTFAAGRKGGDWEVITMLPEGYVGYMIYVRLSARDASVSDVQLTQ